jgi:hypothetical protein
MEVVGEGVVDGPVGGDVAGGRDVGAGGRDVGAGGREVVGGGWDVVGAAAGPLAGRLAPHPQRDDTTIKASPDVRVMARDPRSTRPCYEPPEHGTPDEGARPSPWGHQPGRPAY